MLPGPVFYTELLTTARRWKFHRVLWIYCFAGVGFLYLDYRSISTLNLSLHKDILFLFNNVFISLEVLQTFGLLSIVPPLIAGTIADERRRKTLDYLLVSRLSSGEIVLGKLLSRLFLVSSFIVLPAPIIGAVVYFGEIDLSRVFLFYLGVFTTIFFLGALSILLSTISRRPIDAIIQTYMILAALIFLMPLLNALPHASPTTARVYRIVAGLDEFANPARSIRFSIGLERIEIYDRTVELNLLKIYLIQAFYSTLLITIAILRLRTVNRYRKPVMETAKNFEKKPNLRGKRSAKGAGVARTPGFRRLIDHVIGFRLIQPGACGSNSIIWREIFFRRQNAATRIVATVFIGPLVIGYLIFIGSIVWKSLNLSFGGYSPPTAYELVAFNRTSRNIVLIYYVLAIINISVVAAGSFTSEREGNTWASLAATPLEPLEIVLGKFAGAIWSARFLFVLIGFQLSIGVFLSSLSIFGIVLVEIELGIFSWFVASLGIYCSMKLRSTIQATFVTMITLALVVGGYLVVAVPVAGGKFPPIELFFGCSPMAIFWSILPVDELASMDYITKEWEPTIFLILSVSTHTVAATVLTALCLSRYNRLCDRPFRKATRTDAGLVGSVAGNTVAAAIRYIKLINR